MLEIIKSIAGLIGLGLMIGTIIWQLKTRKYKYWGLTEWLTYGFIGLIVLFIGSLMILVVISE